MFRLHRKYLLLTLIILVVEIAIALFLHDAVIRPYIGDVLVVILIYCFIQSFFNFTVKATALFTLVFSFTIEILQYFNFVEMVGIANYKLARIVIGSSFSVTDLIAYTLGICIVLFLEKKQKRAQD